jgi:pilus assembly protein CpaD
MTRLRTPLALTLATALLLGACDGQVTSYTESEAPKNLALDTSTTHVDVRFAPGSAKLTSADTAQLNRLAATGAIGPADRVTVAATGGPSLAEQRVASVAALLLHYGIVVAADQLAEIPPNHAIVEVNRTLVTLPQCPNWSKPSSVDFSNAPSSNFGCATESNLGLMVANPSDLASGRPGGAAAAQPATAAVRRYLTDTIKPLPSATGATPFSAAASAAPPAAPTTGSQ